MDRQDAALAELARLRPRLFGIAYRMLGAVADAEDAVQEAFLRWEQARLKSEAIESTEAWLVSVVTRICIDQLRSARVRREEYIGQWLPEPLVVDPGEEAEATVETAEALSFAFLLLLERLTPVERAVFLLHEVFGYHYAEIGPMVDKSEAACRQLAKRARERLAIGQPRFHPDEAEGERLAAEFLRACAEGDLPGLLALLTEEVELVGDGGSKAAAAREPIVGRERVARALLGFVPLAPAGWSAAPAPINGGPGLLVRAADGSPFAAMAFDLDGGRIAAIRIVVNPDKLQRISPAES
jgi:RNA polymerase sigma-70 factor (ECF subfamily)